MRAKWITILVTLGLFVAAPRAVGSCGVDAANECGDRDQRTGKSRHGGRGIRENGGLGFVVDDACHGHCGHYPKDGDWAKEIRRAAGEYSGRGVTEPDAPAGARARASSILEPGRKVFA